jgi:anti-anti-sigma regulatory factor
MTDTPAGRGSTSGSPEVTVSVEHRDDVAVARVAGTLTVQTAPVLRGGLLKCLAGCPAALVVDVAGLRAESDLPLTVLRVVQRQASQWPAIPIVLCRPDAALAQQLACAGTDAYPPVYPGVEEAVAALDRTARVRPAVRADLAAIADSCPRARDIVAQACRDWDVAHVGGAAETIVSELVANAVQHGRPPLHFMVAIRGEHLHVAVRDGSPALPPVVHGAPPQPSLEHGRGLYLINALAGAWGSMRTTDGKVVWATLRLTR